MAVLYLTVPELSACICDELSSCSAFLFSPYFPRHTPAWRSPALSCSSLLLRPATPLRPQISSRLATVAAPKNTITIPSHHRTRCTRHCPFTPSSGKRDPAHFPKRTCGRPCARRASATDHTGMLHT